MKGVPEDSYEPARAQTSLHPDEDCTATDTTVPDTGTHETTTSNDTTAKGAARGDEQHAEVTLSATVPKGMGANSKKAKIARGVNTWTEGGDVSLTTPPAEACSEKRKVARVEAVTTDKS